MALVAAVTPSGAGCGKPRSPSPQERGPAQMDSDPGTPEREPDSDPRVSLDAATRARTDDVPPPAAPDAGTDRGGQPAADKRPSYRQALAFSTVSAAVRHAYPHKQAPATDEEAWRTLCGKTTCELPLLIHHPDAGEALESQALAAKR